MSIRLQKYLADAQVASRRKSEEIILSGRVKVNGSVVTELGTKVDENDLVEVDGKPVKPAEKFVYIMLHKPEGYITSAKDQFDRPTVLDIVKSEYRLYPVGRLDYDTSGLLLLTNDGDMTYRLTHPKHNVEKTYIAQIEGTPTEDELRRFETGLEIDGYKTAPAKIKIVKKSRLTTVKIVIHEGKNRQVRRMCAAIGHEVKALKRVATGRLSLNGLEKGKYRELTAEEIEYLKTL
ncbi:MAG: rRNA pseudouridine synthase [Firmicutes bacterium]|nr:rRNA pseudouridine synthase [Bacillota bacterium]MBQ9605043.1 rRNA pseudouridine synthase [Bacillota bacterium]